MVFSSVSFLVFFLPCLLVLYFTVPRRYRGARNFILLAFSLAFYACGGPKFLLLMLLSIVRSTTAAGSSRGQSTAPPSGRQA